MPTFNDYPSRRIEVFDLQDIQRQGLQNQLLQSKLQEYGAAQQRQGQLRSVMGGVGAEAGLGPNAQQALAIDPSQLSALMKIPKAKRDQAKTEIERIGNLLQAVETAPGVQRPQIYAMARQQYAASGADMSGIPETYDPGWVRTQLAEAGKLMAVLKQVEEAAPPAGYRGTEGGLEFIPGGPADPVQTQKLRAASGDTALQKDVPYIAKLAGVSEEEALTMKLESKSKSYKSYVSDIAARYASFGDSPERAHEKAVALGNLVYGRKQPESKDPDTAKGRSWWERVFGGGEPTGQGIDPPRLPNGAIDKSALKEGLVYRHPVNGLKYRWMGKTFEGPLP